MKNEEIYLFYNRLAIYIKKTFIWFLILAIILSFGFIKINNIDNNDILKATNIISYLSISLLCSFLGVSINVINAATYIENNLLRKKIKKIGILAMITILLLGIWSFFDLIFL